LDECGKSNQNETFRGATHFLGNQLSQGSCSWVAACTVVRALHWTHEFRREDRTVSRMTLAPPIQLVSIADWESTLHYSSNLEWPSTNEESLHTSLPQNDTRKFSAVRTTTYTVLQPTASCFLFTLFSHSPSKVCMRS
jgi:hypothetical protein